MVNDSFRPAGQTSRRIGPEDRPLAFGFPFPRRAIALRVAAVPFVWPLFLTLIRGAGGEFVALAAAIGLLFLAARLVDQGLLEGAETVRVAGFRVPPRLTAAALTGLAAFLISLGPALDSGLMALVFGALGFAGCALAYGTEAKVDRSSLLEAARRAGVQPKDVVATLDEARAKIAEIEAAAARLHSRELKARLARIVEQARTVLAMVERKPADIGRARRFFATYLDGTRDVVTAYAGQQRDLADTPLAENFRRVLTTIEQVLEEQQEVLRRDDRLDLEVKIEVLETQMRHEGVH